MQIYQYSLSQDCLLLATSFKCTFAPMSGPGLCGFLNGLDKAEISILIWANFTLLIIYSMYTTVVYIIFYWMVR